MQRKNWRMICWDIRHIYHQANSILGMPDLAESSLMWFGHKLGRMVGSGRFSHPTQFQIWSSHGVLVPFSIRILFSLPDTTSVSNLRSKTTPLTLGRSYSQGRLGIWITDTGSCQARRHKVHSRSMKPRWILEGLSVRCSSQEVELLNTMGTTVTASPTAKDQAGRWGTLSHHFHMPSAFSSY